ncbi:hypothetical protein CEXT_742571 [Caerostris extrusa]|uniref:Uncharacterized protein n=1 Tax=Caerostris extrusa TaxID=172846 RepID=A0AAV4RYL0_CAEEX|nr:hypothetical protein CEXT_742571 [Caerostris extrusa]
MLHVNDIDSLVSLYGKDKSVLSVGGSVTNSIGGASAYLGNYNRTTFAGNSLLSNSKVESEGNFYSINRVRSSPKRHRTFDSICCIANVSDIH